MRVQLLDVVQEGVCWLCRKGSFEITVLIETMRSCISVCDRMQYKILFCLRLIVVQSHYCYLTLNVVVKLLMFNCQMSCCQMLQ